MGIASLAFESAAAFLAAKLPDAPGCLLLDVRMPGVGGLEFQAQMEALGSPGVPSAGATEFRVDPLISDLISLRDVSEILGTAFYESVAALKSAKIEAIRVKRMRGVERRQLLTLCSEIAFVGEAAAWSEINPQRLQAKFAKLGVPRKHGGWVRQDLADLGYVSQYVVE